MTTSAGWAFLVARGTRKGYRTVLAPDFLVQDRRHTLLAEQVGSATSDDRTTRQHITDEMLGHLTVTYRVEPALTAELVDSPTHDGNEVLLDQHGRPLELLYGVVTTTPVSAGGHDMARARTEALISYRRFLADEENTDVQPSRLFILDEAMPIAEAITTPALPAVVAMQRPEGVEVPAPVPPRAVLSADREHTREYRARRPHALVLGLLTVLLLLAVAAGLVGNELWGSGAADEVRVTVHDASERSGRSDHQLCDDVRVVGTIAADRSTSVEYQWKVDGQPITPSRQLTFDGANKLPVRGPEGEQFDATGQSEFDSITRTYELVVTEAGRDGREAKDKYEVECTLKP
jgi:hypothetical protein